MDPQWVQTLVTIASFLVLGTVYIVNGRNAAKLLGTRLEVIDGTMEDFKKEISKLTEVIVAQAIQASRIQVIDERGLAQGRRLDGLSKNVMLILLKMKVDIPVDVPDA